MTQKHKTIKYLGIFLGTVIFALANKGFIVGYQLGTGGLAGLTVLFYYLWKIPLGVTTLAVNLVLFLYLYWAKRFDLIFRTGFSVLVYSLIVDYFSFVQPFLPDSLILGILLSGILYGLGLRTVYSFGGSMGGFNLLAVLISEKTGISLGRVSLAINALIIMGTWFVLGWKIALFSAIVSIISSITMDIGRKRIKIEKQSPVNVE